MNSGMYQFTVACGKCNHLFDHYNIALIEKEQVEIMIMIFHSHIFIFIFILNNL